jgi:hypothetical protein
MKRDALLKFNNFIYWKKGKEGFTHLRPFERLRATAQQGRTEVRRQKNMLAWSDADLRNYLLKRGRNDIK